jgi:tetratricopeptide (TPR) repeat protein
LSSFLDADYPPFVGTTTLVEIAQLEARLAQGLTGQEQGQVEWRLGSLYARVGELEQALAHLTSARRLAVDAPEPRRIAAIDAMLGQVSAHKGEHERAGAFLERAAAAATDAGDTDLMARVATQLGELAMRRGDHPHAREHYERARAHFEKFWEGF